MARNQIIGLLLLLVVIAVGIYAFAGQSGDDGRGSRSSKQEREEKEESREKAMDVASVKDFLTQSGSMRCEIVDKEETVIAYVKNGAIRMDKTGDDQDENAGLIFSNNKFYVWNTQLKQGIMMDVPEASIEELGNKDLSEDDLENVVEAVEKNKSKCQQQAVSDSVFVPPSDIRF